MKKIAAAFSLLILITSLLLLSNSDLPLTPNLSGKPENIPLSPTPQTVDVKLTFYGWADNDPPGKSIAFPKNRYPASYHQEAGGEGTFEDPLTFASDFDQWEVGTIIYLPYLRKYAVMEDLCSACVKEWQEDRAYHVDVWMESEDLYPEELIKCENFWSRESVTVEISPPPDRLVLKKPLFDLQNGKCLTNKL